MTNAFELSVARDFSKFPAGRFANDGPFPGVSFRARLVGALKEHDKVVVLLDGTIGYGSSFLEEAFGGLVRDHGFTASQLHSRLTVISTDKSLVKEVWSYIDSAKPKKDA